ncbi:hypothetical protein L7F22_005194 [Adiantum nelumboides]|nr:hypothetical protein [Adiantum nelumboides]
MNNEIFTFNGKSYESDKEVYWSSNGVSFDDMLRSLMLNELKDREIVHPNLKSLEVNGVFEVSDTKAESTCDPSLGGDDLEVMNEEENGLPILKDIYNVVYALDLKAQREEEQGLVSCEECVQPIAEKSDISLIEKIMSFCNDESVSEKVVQVEILFDGVSNDIKFLDSLLCESDDDVSFSFSFDIGMLEDVTWMYAFQCLSKASFDAHNDVMGVSKLGTALVDMYIKCGADGKVQQALDALLVWDVVTCSFVSYDDFSSADEVESHAYDEVLSFDDVNLHEESCASSIMKEDSFAYMCGKESNIIACLDPCLDNCRDEGLSSSMFWSYMLWNDFCGDVEDMHANILDDIFFPPFDALSRYPDELCIRGPFWDAEMDSDHVCGIVDGTKVLTGDSFDCDQNMACSQSEDYGTFVANDDDDGWGFDEPLMEENLSMASYVQIAKKTQHVLGKAHSVDVLAQDFEPHVENKAKVDIMADMGTRVLMDAYDGRGAMKANMDAVFDKMVVVHIGGWCMIYPFDPDGCI